MPRYPVLAALFLFATQVPSGSAGELAAVFDPIPERDAPPPALAGHTLDGRSWRLSDRRGQVVLASFWAGWCSPCIAEMPGLIRLAERLRGRPFALVGVNAGEPESRVRTLVRQLGIGFAVLADPANAAFAHWGVQILPTAYLIDARGRRRLIAQGPVDWDDPAVLKTIEALMSEIR